MKSMNFKEKLWKRCVVESRKFFTFVAREAIVLDLR